MATFRYLHTFIDEDVEDNENVLFRSRSCPHLGQHTDEQEKGDQALTTYVAELYQRSRALTGVPRGAQAEPLAPLAQAEPEIRQPGAVDMAESALTNAMEESVVADEVVEFQVAFQAEFQAEVAKDKETSQEDVHPAVPQPLGGGSRGHPFLCARPCIRLAKGDCHMGDACAYCHHTTHRKFQSLDKRQRHQVHNMDPFLDHFSRCENCLSTYKSLLVKPGPP